MKKFRLNGFGPVFRYTLKNQLKSKKFILSTILLGVLLFAGIVIALLVSSGSEVEDEKHEFKMVEVYVADETGLGIADYAAFAKATQNSDIEKVTFKNSDDAGKLAEAHKDDPVPFVLLIQKEEEENYLLEVVNNGVDSDEDIEILQDFAKTAFQQHVYANSGLSQEDLAAILMPVQSTVKAIGGEEDSLGKSIMALMSIMVSTMLVYFIVLFYGQTVCTEVSMEKTSKLVEQLLTRVSPNALVSGKVLATIAASIIQVLIWLCCILGGVFAGNVAVGILYDGHKSTVGKVLDIVREWFGSQAFSAPAVVLCLIALIAGLVFYLVLAGFAGSMVTKPEEAPNMQSLFILPMMVAFFIVIFGVMKAEGKVGLIYNLIPFTSAMTAPGCILIGKLSLGMGLLSVLISVLCSVVLMWLSAKIYRGLMFFGGSKLRLKTVFEIIKGK